MAKFELLSIKIVNKFNRRRELLAVEEEANKNKIIEAHGQEHFKAQVMSKFFNKVQRKLIKNLTTKNTYTAIF